MSIWLRIIFTVNMFIGNLLIYIARLFLKLGYIELSQIMILLSLKLVNETLKTIIKYTPDKKEI